MREKYRRLKEIEKEISETFDELLEFWERKYKKKCEECEILRNDKEELEYEVEILKEKIKRIEDDRDENYRPIPISEQLDISDRDFI